jgi:hypothetical protein
MHIMSKQAIIDAAKRAFASEFVVGDADSFPQEFSHWLAVQQNKGFYWSVEL